VQDDSGRKALGTFTGGKGDVLLSYENEAIFAQQNGQDIDYVVPDQTILIENPAAITTDSANPTVAKAWLDYVYTPEAQKIFADNGYRPVVKSVLEKNRKKFPVRPGEFTIDQLGLGGWDKVQKRFFDPDAGIMARIERQVGGVTG